MMLTTCGLKVQTPPAGLNHRRAATFLLRPPVPLGGDAACRSPDLMTGTISNSVRSAHRSRQTSSNAIAAITSDPDVSVVKCGATINTVVNLCHIFPGPRRLGIVVDTTPGIGQQSRDPESRHIDSEGEALLGTHHSLRCILPPDLLERLARSSEGGPGAAAIDTLSLDRRFRMARAESAARIGGF